MDRKLLRTLAISCTALLLHAPNALAANLFAAPAGGGDTCTQAVPCGAGTALGKAVAGDAVWLAAGTYGATAGAPAVTVPTSLALLGGWDGTTTAPPVRDPMLHVTILDGAGVNRGVVVGAGVAALLDGLTVRGGRHLEIGGGIHATDAALTLRNVVVEENAAVGDDATTENACGGGLAITGGSLRVVDSVFRRNTVGCSNCSWPHGGGICANGLDRLEVQGSTFDRNDAWAGSGIWSQGGNDPKPPVVIDSCSFVGNGTRSSILPRDGGYAAGVFLISSAATVTGSAFSGNSAMSDYAAALFTSSNTVFDRNLVVNNVSGGNAGIRVYGGNASVTNNLFVGNTASGSTPVVGVAVEDSYSAVLHNTIVGPAGGGGFGIYFFKGGYAADNILARLNTGLRVTGADWYGTVTNNLWGSGAWANLTNLDSEIGSSLTSSDNIVGDPGFADGAGGDFHILATSAARGIGVITDGTDLDGLPHQTPASDAGAYEYPAALALGFPRGGERLHSGDLSVVRWGAPEGAVTFDVFLSLNDGQTWLPQGAGVGGRSLPIALPVVKRALAKCRVKVVARDGAGARIGKTVSGRFAVEPLTLIAPTALVAIPGGSEYFVRWDSHRLARRVAKVKVAYSLDGGATWKSALPAAIKFDPGMARWTLPIPGADKPLAKVKVTLLDKAGATIGSAVSGVFTIRGPETPGSPGPVSSGPGGNL